VGQHHLEVGGQDWYVDLLFYHRRLRCLVAVDLKIGAFQPEHAGKMNFYLAALDDQLLVAGFQLYQIGRTRAFIRGRRMTTLMR
jgi:hypothetical protein